MSVLFIILKSLTLENLAQIRPFLTANKVWGHLNKLFMENLNIQHSKFGVIQDEAGDFVMHEDESSRNSTEVARLYRFQVWSSS